MMTNILILEGFVEGCASLCCNDEWDNLRLLIRSKFSVEIASYELDSNSVVLGSWEILGKECRAYLFCPEGVKPGIHLQFFCSQPVKRWARLIT